MSIETRTVRVGAVELVVDESGVGGVPLVLLHGFTGDRTDFAMAMGPLADLGWHVVAPDQRGHGASTQPAAEGDYSFDRFAADALGLADALGFERFALLGHSMGGMIAQEVALAAPDRIERLVLMDTLPGPVPGALPEAVALLAGIARASGMDAVADVMARHPFNEPEAYRRAAAADPEYAARGDRLRRRSSPAMFASMLTALAAPEDRLPRLAALDVPTLVLVGEEDEPFLDGSAAMASIIPGARLVVVDGAGHSPQFEAHDAWWSAVEAFLTP